MTEHNEISMLDVTFDDVYDFELLEEDSEVKVRIERAEIHLSDKGNTSLHLVLTVPDNPKVDDIHQYISVPSPALQQEDAKAYNKRKLGLKRVYETFGVDTTQVSVPLSDFVGLEAWAIIGVEQGQGGYSDRNSIKKWVKDA
jgi:hypothetical protein